MPRSIENGINLSISSTQTSSLQSGSAASPSLSFISDSDTGIYNISNGSIGFSTDATQRMSLSNNDLTLSHKLITPALQLTTGASNGHILQSDGSGNASWVAPSSCILTGPVKSTSFANSSGLGTITSASYISYETKSDINRVVNITGKFTFDGTVAEGNSGYVEININSIISGFAPVSVEGVVQKNPFGGGTFAFSIHDANTIIRITLTNSTAAPWITSTSFNFNITAINS